MVTPAQLTVAFYNALPAGSIEYASGVKPLNADALQARARAIQEGRLRVLADEDLDDEPCVGCTAQRPSIAGGLIDPNEPTYQAPRDYYGLPLVPGGYRATLDDVKDIDRGFFLPNAYPKGDVDRPTRPRVTMTNADGQVLLLEFESVTIAPESGTCNTSSGCTAGDDCEFPCSVLFSAQVDSAKPVTFPPITFDGPGTLGSATVSPANVRKNGNTNAADYTYQFTQAVPCGNVLKFHVSFLKLDGLGGINPTATGWTPQATSDRQPGALWLQFVCESCRGQLA